MGIIRLRMRNEASVPARSPQTWPQGGTKFSLDLPVYLGRAASQRVALPSGDSSCLLVGRDSVEPVPAQGADPAWLLFLQAAPDS